jgi:hypothetical protein
MTINTNTITVVFQFSGSSPEELGRAATGTNLIDIISNEQMALVHTWS